MKLKLKALGCEKSLEQLKALRPAYKESKN